MKTKTKTPCKLQGGNQKADYVPDKSDYTEKKDDVLEAECREGQ